MISLAPILISLAPFVGGNVRQECVESLDNKFKCLDDGDDASSLSEDMNSIMAWRHLLLSDGHANMLDELAKGIARRRLRAMDLDEEQTLFTPTCGEKRKEVKQ